MWETRTRGSLLLNEVAISVCHNIDTKDPVREDFNMIMTWLTSSIFQESGSHCRDSTGKFVRESCCTSMPPSTGMVCLCDTTTYIPKPLISACAGFNPQAGMRLRWGGWRPSLGELGGWGVTSLCSRNDEFDANDFTVQCTCVHKGSECNCVSISSITDTLSTVRLGLRLGLEVRVSAVQGWKSILT